MSFQKLLHMHYLRRAAVVLALGSLLCHFVSDRLERRHAKKEELLQATSERPRDNHAGTPPDIVAAFVISLTRCGVPYMVKHLSTQSAHPRDQHQVIWQSRVRVREKVRVATPSHRIA